MSPADPHAAVVRFQPRPTSASGKTRSFGDVGFDVRFARKRRRLRIYEYTPLVRTQTGCVRCAAIVPARAVRACATVSWRPTGDPGSYQSNDGAPGPSACPRQRYGRKAMIDSSRRTVLTTGAAAAATAAAPQVFAQAPQTSAPQGAPAGAKTGYYERGNVRIRYTEIGTGFPLLATPGGGLNSRIAIWANAVINIPEEFKNDFRVITMDQRNATGGESTGPVPVDDPWGAFADDQLGLMDHLGIRQFFFFGNCIGGPFAMKLMERAPQ